ncbi:hypothetical protein PV755_16410 [Streptomyces caniscabiei]|uniref:Uncharacterized protein n=1 Tax=Streptomyces caniscabiei TaxID=2746961 RepID=A0A927L423_9ACTN|nr:hypothetical protein [Streptomyces caniscabiei]MBD9724924.1 hypothetical protein [Streptomyces caniscabiei]MDX3510505.1 hypothetical protein [Streptomyces caniscabiei]MDX3720588.1 hypothetical protein [Streptomyces caniscabiei]WEO26127.1 hypothetical protein IHE65_24815 [Streptomyces caniscabiei]
MSQPTPPPGPPVPGPDGDHGRRSVRIAMISLVVSSVLTVIGFVVTATTSDRGGGTNGGTTSGSTTTTGGTDGGDTEGTDSGGTAGATAGGTDTSGTDTSGTDTSGTDSGGTDSGGTDTGAAGGGDDSSGGGDDDGLTTAERDLRDSLNDSQWTRESCVSEIAPGSDAAVTCTVTTESVTMGEVTTKASVAVYPSRSKQQEVYQAYGGTLQEGDCSQMWNVRGSWYESDSGDPTGDMSCYTPDGTQYVIVCTYYDRNAVFQVLGGDPRTLITWWEGLEPVFVD